MKLKIIAVTTIALLLSACGGSGPSEKEVRSLMMQEFEKVAMVASFFSSTEEMEAARKVVEGVELKSCKKFEGAPAHFGDEVYNCTLKMGDVNRGKNEKFDVDLKLAKVNDNWIALEDLFY